jgi:hypothetical protein
MKFVVSSLTHLYAKLIHLYPIRFRAEFAEEMQIVFEDALNDAIKDGIRSVVILCLREYGGLPFNVMREFWHEHRKENTIMDMNEQTESKSAIEEAISHWDALICTLPFVLFAVASSIGRIPFWGIYAGLAFYVIVLLGLLIGLVKGVPRWAYGYIGWSLVFAWNWQIWPPLLMTIGIALLWTRSLLPLRQVVRGVWLDSTRLSLTMYTLVGFVMLLYDENHSPYWIGFMIISTLTIAASVWFFMMSTKASVRFIALVTGFVTSLAINWICDTTWDFAAYYGLPVAPPAPWYDSIIKSMAIAIVWGGILIWPAAIDSLRRSLSSE